MHRPCTNIATGPISGGRSGQCHRCRTPPAEHPPAGFGHKATQYGVRRGTFSDATSSHQGASDVGGEDVVKERHMANTIRFLVVAGLIGAGGEAFSAVPTNNMSVSVAIDHEKGSFAGMLGITLKGTFNKANLRWNGSVKNTSPHRIFRAAFCMKAFDADDNVIQVQDTSETCLLRFWGTKWEAGAPLNFKGKQNIRIAPGNKAVVQVSRYEISATEVFDHAPNVRHIVASCPVVWRSAIREFADSSFHPKVIQQDSYVGNFEYEGGQTSGRTDSRSMLKRYTNARLGIHGSDLDWFQDRQRLTLPER